MDSENRIMIVPHMGWNQVRQTKNHALWRDIPDHSRFYFVHSYYIDTEDLEKVAGITNYGLDIVSCLSKENIFAVQFHPELKSKPFEPHPLFVGFVSAAREKSRLV